MVEKTMLHQFWTTSLSKKMGGLCFIRGEPGNSPAWPKEATFLDPKTSKPKASQAKGMVIHGCYNI
jgi:hypothetical protein